MTLHNFSFRNDPLNAPKGQEVIRAIDEIVDIFPNLPKLVQEHKVAPSPVIVSKAPIAPAPSPAPAPSTSLTPSLPSGLLKVKMFGKRIDHQGFSRHTIPKNHRKCSVNVIRSCILVAPATVSYQIYQRDQYHVSSPNCPLKLS